MKTSNLFFTGLLLCLFKIALDLIFCVYIIKNYSYYVFVEDYSLIKLLLMNGELIVFIPFFAKFVSGEQIKDKILMFLSFIYFIPGLSVYQFIKIDIMMFMLWNVFWWSLILFSYLPTVDIYFTKMLDDDACEIKRHIQTYLVYGCIYFTIIVVLYISWKYADFRFIITFTDEYILREEERKIVLPPLIRYFYAFSSVLFSLLIAYYTKHKQYVYVGALVVFQLYNFSIGGHKTILLMVATAVGFVLFSEIIKKRKFDYVIILILTIEPWVELLFAVGFDSMTLMQNISRRVYIIPQLLNTYYYEYFLCNGYDWYTQSFEHILGLEVDYSQMLQVVISNEYFGTNGNANNGLFSEAYSNMGGVGCILLPMIILFVIRVIDFFLRKQSYVIKLYYAFICAFIFGSGNVTTGLFTNGLLISALVLYFLIDISSKEKNINDISK